MKIVVVCDLSVNALEHVNLLGYTIIITVNK